MAWKDEAAAGPADPGVSMADDLARATGYRVDTADGRIGSVAAVLPRPGREAPGALLVHTGLLSCRLTAVPFDEVEGVDVDAQRVVLRELRQPEGPALRRRWARRTSSAPHTTRGKAARSAKSVARSPAVSKTRCNGGA
jgi:hypothetical protein